MPRTVLQAMLVPTAININMAKAIRRIVRSPFVCRISIPLVVFNHPCASKRILCATDRKKPQRTMFTQFLFCFAKVCQMSQRTDSNKRAVLEAKASLERKKESSTRMCGTSLRLLAGRNFPGQSRFLSLERRPKSERGLFMVPQAPYRSPWSV